jgi:hypothetical protein
MYIPNDRAEDEKVFDEFVVKVKLISLAASTPHRIIKAVLSRRLAVLVRMSTTSEPYVATYICGTSPLTLGPEKVTLQRYPPDQPPSRGGYLSPDVTVTSEPPPLTAELAVSAASMSASM